MDRNAKERTGAVVKAVGINGIKRMLDLGGGSGAYSIAFARAIPGLQSEILDRVDVVPLAQENIGTAGLADRITTRVGDMLRDPLGENYDLILASAILSYVLSRGEPRVIRTGLQRTRPQGAGSGTGFCSRVKQDRSPRCCPVLTEYAGGNRTGDCPARTLPCNRCTRVGWDAGLTTRLFPGAGTRAAAALYQSVAIEHGMDGAFGRDLDVGEAAAQALADFTSAPTGVLVLHVQDEVLHLKGKLMGIAIGTAASIGQPMHSAFLIMIEGLVTGLARDPELPAQFRHAFAR